MAGRVTTTTLQTIQTANARKSAGMEIQRFRFATAFPSLSQNSLSSGFQTVNMRDAIGSLLKWIFAALPLFPGLRSPPAIQDGGIHEKSDRQKEQVNQLGERQEGEDQERTRRVQLEHQGKIGHVLDLRVEHQERMEIQDGRIPVPEGAPADEDAHVKPGDDFEDQKREENPIAGGGHRLQEGGSHAADQQHRQAEQGQQRKTLPDVLQQEQGPLVSEDRPHGAGRDHAQQMGDQHRDDAVMPRNAAPVEFLPFQELGGIGRPGEPVREEPVRGHDKEQRKRDIGKNDEQKDVQHGVPSSGTAASASHRSLAASTTGFQGESPRAENAAQSLSTPGITHSETKDRRASSSAFRARWARNASTSGR